MKITEWDVPDGKTGSCRVETFTVTRNDSLLSSLGTWTGRGRGVPPGEYKRLFVNGVLMMTNTPDELRDQRRFTSRARSCETVLLHGLGLGVTLSRVLDSDVVRNVTVVEKNRDVLEHVGTVFSRDPRVELVLGDALTWVPARGRRWDAVWHDIWPTICADNLIDMTRLHRRFGRRSGFQDSWARSTCRRLAREDSGRRWRGLFS